MGQQCSTLTCAHVENPETAEMSRLDSPDPVMYDLMRKSIQATAVMWNSGDDTVTATGETASASGVTTLAAALSKTGKRRPVGQSHLLYKNNLIMSKSSSVKTTGVSVTKKTHSSPLLSTTTLQASSEKNVTTRRGMESRSGGKAGSKIITTRTLDDQRNSTCFCPVKEFIALSTNEDPASPSTFPSPLSSHLKCPTRLLIRRRSLRVVEEGGGTHIYAIRYPEDSSQMILSEQAATFSSLVRQEQCPPRKSLMTTGTTSAAHSSQQTSGFTKDGGNNSYQPCQPFEPSATHQVPATVTTTTGITTSTEDKVKKPSVSDSSSSSSSIQGLSKSFPVLASENVGDLFAAASMAAPPRQSVLEWVTVSEEHNIYVADVGLTAEQCDELVGTTEQVCRGQYAAYTYAKQTLGCREFPILAQSSLGPVHTIVHAIVNKFPLEKTTKETTTTTTTTTTPQSNVMTKTCDNNDCTAKDKGDKTLATVKDGDIDKIQEEESHRLQLDDREPHIVKYDVTRKERQRLDMHTDKSEWTFLIALSNGCGVDYEGGGTYFECLDATVHIQRGHALVFPGKLRHCGQKITSGLRFLLVGFLVDKPTTTSSSANGNGGGTSPNSKSVNTSSRVVSPTTNPSLADANNATPTITSKT